MKFLCSSTGYQGGREGQKYVDYYNPLYGL